MSESTAFRWLTCNSAFSVFFYCLLAIKSSGPLQVPLQVPGVDVQFDDRAVQYVAVPKSDSNLNEKAPVRAVAVSSGSPCKFCRGTIESMRGLSASSE